MIIFLHKRLDHIVYPRHTILHGGHHTRKFCSPCHEPCSFANATNSKTQWWFWAKQWVITYPCVAVSTCHGFGTISMHLATTPSTNIHIAGWPSERAMAMHPAILSTHKTTVSHLEAWCEEERLPSSYPYRYLQFSISSDHIRSVCRPSNCHRIYLHADWPSSHGPPEVHR